MVLIWEKDDDESCLVARDDDEHDGGDDVVVFKEKVVSAAGFVDRLHMRTCIKVFTSTSTIAPGTLAQLHERHEVR